MLGRLYNLASGGGGASHDLYLRMKMKKKRRKRERFYRETGLGLTKETERRRSISRTPPSNG